MIDIFYISRDRAFQKYSFFSTRPQRSCKIYYKEVDTHISPRLKMVKNLLNMEIFKCTFLKKCLMKNFCSCIFDYLTTYSLSYYVPIFWDHNLCLRPLQRRCGLLLLTCGWLACQYCKLINPNTTFYPQSLCWTGMHPT